MSTSHNSSKRIKEISYLNTDNTWRYRPIIRTVFSYYEKMKNWVLVEEILEHLVVHEEFSEYTSDQLKSDLNSLVEWGNLIAIADTRKVTSIDEFKNRAFRYQLSQTTIEIERLLIRLDQMTVENTATLEASLVENFRIILENCDVNLDPKAQYHWWKDLNGRFQMLNQNYQDYISRFYNPKNEELMKSTDFLIYKESFIKYLRSFIRMLQLNTQVIQEILIEITSEDMQKILEGCLIYEQQIQTLQVELREKDYMELNMGRFLSMREWFTPIQGRSPLSEQLVENTNEIIRKITRFAASIADKKNSHANRKSEYLKLARLFKEQEDLYEAHKLSALLMGSTTITKVLAHVHRNTENINSSIYEEEPRVYQINPRVRTYREKTLKNPIRDLKDLKEINRLSILQQREDDEKILNRFIIDDEINFGQLPVLTPKERTILLTMLSRGQKKRKDWQTQGNQFSYRVEGAENSPPITLICQDGTFSMPHYRLIIKRR